MLVSRFDEISGVLPGTKGGSSKSAAKAKASRANGVHGGRPRNRTLGETILRRKLTDSQGKAIDEAYMQLTATEKELFRNHYTLPKNPHLDTDKFTPQTRKLNQTMQHVLRKFRLIARHELRHAPKPRPQKPYVVVYGNRSDAEQASWARRHPDGPPCPPLPTRVYYRKMETYIYYDRILATNPAYELTEKDIMDDGGGRVTEKIAEHILKDLRLKYPKPETT